VLTQKIKAQQHAVRKERLVNYALSVQREIATTDGKINLIDDLSELQVKISRLQYLLEKESLLNLASEQMQSFNDTKANGKSLSDLLRTVRDFNRSKKVHEDNLKKVREELDTYLSTELKGTCPVCSNAIEGDIDLGIFL
jgi:rubrerythrin